MQFLILTGLLALLGQVVLLRELNVAFFGVELVYVLAIGAWMCGTALGSLVPSRGGGLRGSAVRWLTLASGAAIPLDVAFVRASRSLLGGVAGAYLPFPLQLLGLLLAVLPVSLLLGLLFQRAAHAYVENRHTLAEAYGIESVGGLAGGLAVTLLLQWGVQNFALAAACAAIAAVGAIARDDARRPTATITLRSASALVLCAAVMALWRAGDADRAMTRWNHPALVASRDTPYGRVTVTRAEGQVSVFENDALAFETQGTAAEELVHLAAIQHPNPRRILLLGGGLEGLAFEALKHQPAQIDDVEMDRKTVESVLPHLPARVRASLRSPSVRLTFADPRRFLRSSGRYDLILVAMGEPNSGQANRFFTREFFTECSARLTEGGVLAYRLQSAENIWTPLLTGRMLSLLRAPALVFPHVVVLPGTTNIVLASPSPLLDEPDALAARLSERGVRTRLVNPQFIRYLYTNDRRAAIERTLARPGTLVNTDTRPVCYQYAALLWLSKFFPGLSTWDITAGAGSATRAGTAIRWALAAVLPAVLFAAVRRGSIARRVVLVLAAGLAGMVLETVLLLHFQARNGVLYQDVGLLLTAFMGGLAAGALVMARVPARLSTTSIAGGGIAVCLAVQAFLIARQAGDTGGASLVATASSLSLVGALVAALFAFASLRAAENRSRMIGPLYAADLAGGAVGAVAGSLLLIPLAGLPASALVMALLAALAVLLV
jgi:spermidine synthase